MDELDSCADPAKEEGKFNIKLLEILMSATDEGIALKDLIEMNVIQIYTIFKNNSNISVLMMNYVNSVSPEDMKETIISLLRDSPDDKISDTMVKIISLSSQPGDNLKLQFILSCVCYMRYHLLPLTIQLRVNQLDLSTWPEFQDKTEDEINEFKKEILKKMIGRE